jgi:hypothetical protein
MIERAVLKNTHAANFARIPFMYPVEETVKLKTCGACRVRASVDYSALSRRRRPAAIPEKP